MYCAYKLEGIGFDPGAEWLKVGKQLEAENLKKARKSLDAFTNPKGEINAAEVMQEWFNDISASVFISHSHADKDLALTLAGWLSNTFGISSFVDSCAWGHARELLLEIDNAHCKTSDSTYSYVQSSVTASHVHLMLSTALSQMMDRCECFFFLSTENSLNPVSISEMVKGEKTGFSQSPWLFHELSMMRLIRRRELSDYRQDKVIKMANLSEAKAVKAPVFNYPVDLSGVATLQNEELMKWSNSFQKVEKEIHALDLLYKVKSPDSSTKISD